MKFMLKVGLLSLSMGFLINGPKPCYASIADRFILLGNTFKESPRVAVGESATVIYAYCPPTRGGDRGTNRAGTITPMFYWGVLSADAGLLSGDLDAPSKESGLPLAGGSIHVDQVLNILVPELAGFLHGFIPGTAERFVYRVQFGAGFAHDFTNERFLPTLYCGPTVSF